MTSDDARAAPDARRSASPGSSAEHALYEDFSRLNNELTNLQRDLVRKNVELVRLHNEKTEALRQADLAAIELQQSEQRYRVLNAELENRVSARTVELDRARKEAESANRAKSEFLAMISHEIRTPMNGVIGMIEILGQRKLGPSEAEMVHVAHESARSLLEILDDLLDFSQADVGKLQLVNEPLQLADVVAQACKWWDGAAARRGVSLTVSLDPQLPVSVLGDKARIRQMLVKLVGNAIKFSKTGDPHAKVSVRADVVERQGDAMTIELVVADNGIGMSAETVARLFTPFSQADATSTRRQGGIGLGLAIVDKLAGLMGGRISVRSEPASGSTFIAHLRFVAGHPDGNEEGRDVAPERAGTGAATGAPPTREEARRQGRLILVAEDNAFNRSVIARQLRLLGFAADFAADGREALEKWRSGDFGLVLSDLHMPEMDGYALAASIRAEEDAGRRTPIVALTANALHDEEARCLAVGMDAFLTKPTPLTRLKETLEAGLAGLHR